AGSPRKKSCRLGTTQDLSEYPGCLNQFFFNPGAVSLQILILGRFSLLEKSHDTRGLSISSADEAIGQCAGHTYLNIVGKVLDKLKPVVFEDLIPEHLFSQSRFLTDLAAFRELTIQSVLDLAFDSTRSNRLLIS